MGMVEAAARLPNGDRALIIRHVVQQVQRPQLLRAAQQLADRLARAHGAADIVQRQAAQARLRARARSGHPFIQRPDMHVAFLLLPAGWSPPCARSGQPLLHADACSKP